MPVSFFFFASKSWWTGYWRRWAIKMTNLKHQTKLAVKKWPFKWWSSEFSDIGHILSYFFSGNFMTNVGYNFSKRADIKSASNASVFTRFKLSHCNSSIEF